MNYSHRAFLYGPVGLLVIVLIAVGAYWWQASGAIARKLDAMNGREVAPGIHFSFAKKTMAGFPFRVDGELDGLTLSIDTSHGPAVWKAEKFAFHSLTYGRTQFVFEAAGHQHIEWHKDNGDLHSFDFLPGALRASAIVKNDRLARFDLQALNVDSPDIAAAEVQFHLRDDPKIDGVDVYAFANNVHFAADERPAFGEDVKHFDVNALVSPGSSFTRLLSGHGDWRQGANDWHARHGGVLVNSLDVNWGPLNATGKGALAIDDLHRPLGTLHLTVDGLEKLKDIPPDSGLAKAVAANIFGDASQPLNTVLAFKDGVAFVGNTPADLLSPLY
jgi:hypothetical protein